MDTDIIGSLVSFGYGQEATRGTAVAPTRWIGRYDLSFIPKSDKIVNESAFNHIMKNSGMKSLRNYGEGSITAKLFDEAIGDFFKMIAGQEPTSVAVPSQSGAIDHTFSLLNSNMHPSYTFAISEGEVSDKRFPGGMISSLSLDIAVDDYAKMTAEFISEEGADASNTVATSQETEFIPDHASIKVIAKGGDLSAAAVVADVRSASLEMNMGILRKETLSNKRVNPRNGRMEITGEIEIYYNNTTFREYYENDTELALRIELENTEVTIGVSTHPKVTVDVPFMMIENWEPDYSNDDLVPQTLSIRGFLDADSGVALSLKVRNTVANYDDPA